MDNMSDIDTVQMGYEETAIPSQQPQFSHTQTTPTPPEHSEVHDALTLATMLQQLRTQTLSGEMTAESEMSHA